MELKTDRRFQVKQKTALAQDGGLIGWAYHDPTRCVRMGTSLVPAWFVIWLPGPADRVAVSIEADMVDGHMTCTDVHVVGKPGVSVTGLALRNIAPDSLVNDVTRLLTEQSSEVEERVDDNGRPFSAFTMYAGGKRRKITAQEKHVLAGAAPTRGRKRLPDSHYREVAAAYVEGASRVQAVADRMGSSFSTAARWVRKAREMGFITEVDAVPARSHR